MRFLSVCSGIEAASVAWGPLGWKAVAFSEIEPFPCAVLAHHYPDVPNWGDMTKYKEWPDVSIDLLCGGTPCQSFSVAGLRKGLDDPRGNLMLTFGAIAAKYRPQWLVWENVPGVLSSNGGADFGAFLGMLGELGYGFAYRVLDAQYFGVPQRRRRVFVVGCLGDWRSAAAVLFERHSLSGHPAPRRQAGQRPAGGTALGVAFGGNNTSGPIDTAAGLNAKGGAGRMDFDSETFITHAPEIAATMVARSSRGGGQTNSPGHQADQELIVTHSLRGEGFDASEDGTERGTPLVPVLAFDTTQITSAANYSNPKAGDPCHPLAAQAHVPCIAFPERMSGTQCASTEDLAPSMGALNPTAIAFDSRMRGAEPAVGREERPPQTMIERTGAIDATKPWNVATAMQVRRLTPVECARLQGFPDDYLDITVRGKPAADGPKYKALGNSWAVPNVRWIGQRIDAVAAITKQRQAA